MTAEGAPAVAARNRLPFAALGFGLAAAFASWNPVSAPFGLVVGVAAVAIAVRALRRPGRRRVAAIGLAAAVVAVAASVVVLALTAGVGREPGGTPVVQPPTRDEVSAELDAARDRTRAARDRARQELDSLDPQGTPTAGLGAKR